jgi:hypothetical protein
MTPEEKRRLIFWGLAFAVIIPLAFVSRFYFDLWYLNWMTGN